MFYILTKLFYIFFMNFFIFFKLILIFFNKISFLFIFFFSSRYCIFSGSLSIFNFLIPSFFIFLMSFLLRFIICIPSMKNPIIILILCFFKGVFSLCSSFIIRIYSSFFCYILIYNITIFIKSYIRTKCRL